MSAVDDQARSSPGCIDDESLAAYVDGRLDPAERRAVELHASQCSRCRAMLVETAAFVEEDTRAHKAPRFRVTGAKAALLAAALAAGVVLLVRVTFLSSRQPATASRPELAGLVAAAAHEPTRLVEGRLTGGFAYKPPPVPTRGAGDRNISPELKIAAAQIEQTMRGKDTAEAAAALGDSYLAVGDLNRAVENLEAAVDQNPDDARYQNDLAAAYIARASRVDRADDWPKAFAAAERAAKRNPQLIEPCFNRARALEGLTLASDAAEAWTACAEREPGSPWASEARARAQAIRDRLDAGKNRPRSRQQDREEIEDHVLVRWAESERAGAVGEADGALADAERMARALADAGGDTMARDEVALIRRSARGSRVRADLVQAHLAYGRARQAFIAERLSDARTEMDAAAAAFGRAGSQYQYWAPIFRAIPLWIASAADQSLFELSSIPIDRLPETFYHLRGRVAWTKAMALVTNGRFDLGIPLAAQARDLFLRAGETEYASVNASYVAEWDSYVGTREQMWMNAFEALRHVDELPPGSRRTAIIDAATVLALRDGLYETALAFEDHSLSLARGTSTVSPTAYIRRGETFGRMGDTEAGLADLTRAEAEAQHIDNAPLRDWIIADTNTARAEILALKDPSAAIRAADAALAFAGDDTSVTLVRVSELLLSRARAHEVSGDLTRAAADYEGAIAALERDEDKVVRPQQRKAAYDEQRTAVREAVRFHAMVRHDAVTALGLAERARARALRQTLTHETAVAPNPALAHTSLPHGIAVLYYVTLSDRVLGWLLTTDQSFQFTAPMDARRFRGVMQRVHKRIATGSTAADLASELQYLESFIRPALPALTPGTTLVVIPDEGLHMVPFAALRDLKGTPLIKNYPVLLAPSYSTLLLASERLTDFEADSVVAIGDGHDASDGELPRLVHADAEAVAVSRVYPRAAVFTGAHATVRNVQTAIQPVVHFAGHTIANAEFPFLSQLLFAPDPTRGDTSGVLAASDIVKNQFSAAKVVVLASCESAAGRFIPGEGFDSVARIFLDAGVPSVVASLWPVDDDQSSLLIEFHRQLRATRDVARALRAAQLTELGNDIDSTPLRRWAGFVAFGGVNITRPLEGMYK